MMRGSASFWFIILLIISTCIGIELWQYYCPPNKIVMSYYVPSDRKSDVTTFQRKVDELNVLAYSFLKVDIDGRVVFNENDLGKTKQNLVFCQHYKELCKSNKTFNKEPGNFDFFLLLQNKSKSLKKIIALGGAGEIASFFNAINYPENFVDSLSAIINEYQLDGMDFDFEINRAYSAEEAKKYADLFNLLRKKLGPEKIITIDTLINQDTLESLGSTNWKVIADNSNWISMMCYDLISPLHKPYYTQIGSNLFFVENAPPQLVNAYLSCDSAIRSLNHLGVDHEKIVLGVPAFGIAYGGIPPDNNGLFQRSDQSKTPQLDDLGKGILSYSTLLNLRDEGFKEYTTFANEKVNGAWLYDKINSLFITFDNSKLIRSKVDYIKKKNLAGIMIWRVGQDAAFNELSGQTSLMKAIVERLYTPYVHFPYLIHPSDFLHPNKSHQ